MNGLAERGRAPYAIERASQGSSGFSMVELLVAIVLAGIVFAAMVPVFVNAAETSIADQTRNVALNVAQDRVERIRDLPFDSITTKASLDSLLGTTWTSLSGSSSRTYDIEYEPQAAPESPPSYVSVKVTVSWTAPPRPVKPVVLTTIVANPLGTSAVAPSPSPSGTTTPTPSPSGSATPTPTPTPTPSQSVVLCSLVVSTNTWNNIISVGVVRTDVVPNVTFAAKANINPNTPVADRTWTNLPAGTYAVNCYCLPSKPHTITTTATLVSGSTTVAFDNLPWWW